VSKIKIGGIIHHPNLICISLSGISNQAPPFAVVLDALGNANINVQFIVKSTCKGCGDQLVFCLDRDDQEKTLDIIHRIQNTHNINILIIEPEVSGIGIYGPDFRLKSGLAGMLLGALDAAEINVQAVSASLSTISIIISSTQVDRALSAIHQVFELP
jgi:aspartate kinase